MLNNISQPSRWQSCDWLAGACTVRCSTAHQCFKFNLNASSKSEFQGFTVTVWKAWVQGRAGSEALKPESFKLSPLHWTWRLRVVTSNLNSPGPAMTRLLPRAWRPWPVGRPAAAGEPQARSLVTVTVGQAPATMMSWCQCQWFQVPTVALAANSESSPALAGASAATLNMDATISLAGSGYCNTLPSHWQVLLVPPPRLQYWTWNLNKLQRCHFAAAIRSSKLSSLILFCHVFVFLSLLPRRSAWVSRRRSLSQWLLLQSK